MQSDSGQVQKDKTNIIFPYLSPLSYVQDEIKQLYFDLPPIP